MRIHKRALALLLAVSSLFGLVACGGVQAETLDTDSALISQPQSLTMAENTSLDLPFNDIPANADYAQAVAWCYKNGLMQGTSATEFSPNGTLTRAMAATILYRAAGEPAVTGNPAFTDTQSGVWYSNAVTWANGREIIHGYDGGLFGPNDPVTREQLQIMIVRYNKADSTWNGDSAANVPATRAEAAVAFYTHLLNSPATSVKTLVAYYSATGSTERVAGYIAQATNGDLFKLQPVEEYTSDDLNYGNSSSRVSREHDDPELQNQVKLINAVPDNWNNYDVVFIGYPIWWGTAAWSVNQFVTENNFSDKTVIPFCTSASSPLGQSGTLLAKVAGEGNWLPGQRFQSGTDQSAVEAWINGLDLPLQGNEDGKPVVYMTTDISSKGLLTVYNALEWTPTGKVAVKLSTGEPPASNYLRPELIKDVVQLVDGTIVECNTAYGGSRASTAMHYQVAKDHGFNDIADVVILDENGSMTLPVTGGTVLGENYVGAHFEDYDSYLVLSHFKGHAMAGSGGAIKNISIGLGSSEGKCWIHSGGTSRTSPWGGDQTAFTESMAEAGKSVSDYLDNGDKIVYVNVMNRLSIDCDCDGNPAEPDMHDVGILASTDPVALDQACIDLVYAQKDGDGASLVNRIESRNGLHTLEHAEEIGLGSREYELVSIDN